MRLISIKLPLLLGLALMLLTVSTEARAEYVDWSSYIDHSAPARTTTTTQAPAKTARPQKRVARAGKTKASKAKVKARAKSKPRRK